MSLNSNKTEYNIDDYLNDFDDDMINDLMFDLNTDIKVKDVIDINKCDYCDNTNVVITVDGFIVCESCDAVKNINIKNGINEYQDDGSNSYSYGSPINQLYPKSSMGTTVKIRGNTKLNYIIRQNNMPYKEKSRYNIFKNQIQQRCRDNNITQVISDTAKILYKRICDCKHLSGERKGEDQIRRCVNLRSMIAICVFQACKEHNQPISTKKIAQIYDLNIKNINSAHRQFMELIKLHNIEINDKNTTSTDFIRPYGEILEIEDKYIDLAIDVSNNINRFNIATTHEPPSVAAGCILLISNLYNLNVEKKKIREIFDISEVTISKAYRAIKPNTQFIINNNVADLVYKKRMILENNTDTFEINSLDELVVKDNTNTIQEKKSKNLISKVKGKRGRKPKPKTEAELNKPKRKRGRPRKNPLPETENNKNKDLLLTEDSETIVDI